MPRRRAPWLSFSLALIGLLAGSLSTSYPIARAQDKKSKPASARPDAEETTSDAAAAPGSTEEPALRPPTLDAPKAGAETSAAKPAAKAGAASSASTAGKVGNSKAGDGKATDGKATDGKAESGKRDPGKDVSLMNELAPPEAPATTGWTAPQTALTLNGYFRTRFELFENFSLGRVPTRSGQADLPFSRFIPADRSAYPSGGCGDKPDADPIAGACPSNSAGVNFASMRLRLAPTLTVSDDLRVHAVFDVFDNLVLGSTPSSGAYSPPGATGGSTTGFFRPTRGSADTVSGGQDPPTALRNGWRDSIVARRAWAEVSNRDLGQLSFGRMGAHWGLGIVHNAGEGYDADMSTDVDRIMLMTRLFGFTWMAARDFAGEGSVFDHPNSMSAVPFDLTNRDDIEQWVFAVARRMEPTEQAKTLRAGGWVLNGGVLFMYRHQLLSDAKLTNPYAIGDLSVSLVRRNANIFTPDVWAQFLWGDLRIEIEAAMVAGTIENLEDTHYGNRKYNLLQFGGAMEAEYRMLDRKLAIRLYSGFATGDNDVDGLSASEGVLRQQTTNSRISTFEFNPAYRVDLILWRNIMERVAGAWYVRPGIGYDVIKQDNGLLLGGRIDAVYSRAMKLVQTYGSEYNLGIEGNATIYFRTAGGPGPLSGFHAQMQYGLLVPMAGLGYPTYRGVSVTGATTPSVAHAFRVVGAVQF